MAPGKIRGARPARTPNICYWLNPVAAEVMPGPSDAAMADTLRELVQPTPPADDAHVWNEKTDPARRWGRKKSRAKQAREAETPRASSLRARRVWTPQARRGRRAPKRRAAPTTR